LCFALNLKSTTNKIDLKHKNQKELKNIKIPVTIIWGEDDEILSLDYARRLNKLIKNSKLIIVKGNHDWLVLEYEQAGKLVKEGLI